jgi:Zn-finger nucleic acid-binding protein/DNA-directed RNA polymerase subunit RPC12/RpoP
MGLKWLQLLSPFGFTPVRVLVACHQCHRRYEAQQRKIGTKFRCHCGTVLLVKQPKGHEARVVRCSACGGARQSETRNCGFCGSDFTLHERDLNTVCPNCLARVSDKARYCTECGDWLSAETIAGDSSPMHCPACSGAEQLASRELGHEKLNVLECQSCTGLWLSVETFRELRDRVARKALHLEDAALKQSGPKVREDQDGPLYRPCAACKRLMSRKLYAPGSGVIIDICKDHGLWFDATELHHVLAWIAKGGNPKDPLEAAHERNRKEKRKPVAFVEEDTSNDFLDEILAGLLGSVFQWFRR